MGDIIKFDVPVSENVVLDPDTILEKAKGVFHQVAIIGYDESGEFQVRSTHSSREVLWMLNRAIVHLMLETE